MSVVTTDCIGETRIQYAPQPQIFDGVCARLKDTAQGRRGVAIDDQYIALQVSPSHSNKRIPCPERQGRRWNRPLIGFQNK